MDTGGTMADAQKKKKKQKFRSYAAASKKDDPEVIRKQLRLKNMKDPELYSALMAECSREERTRPGQLYDPPELVRQFLQLNDVRPLKKRSTKFPKAPYYCRLCDYHCDTLNICISHIKDTRHSRLARMQEVEATLYHLPSPTKEHLEVLDDLLQEVQQRFGLRDRDIESRMKIVENLDGYLKQNMGPETSCHLFGSCVGGYGTKESSLNIDLRLPEGMPQHLGLIKAFEVLKLAETTSPVIRMVRSEFSEKIPKVTFLTKTEPNTPDWVSCEVSLNNKNAFKTTLLLRDYLLKLDPRIRRLAISVRVWAQLCGIDNAAEGTLSPRTYMIMLIFYLQQVKKPVLPCIHDYLDDADDIGYEETPAELSKWKTENDSCCAELYIGFFEFYSLAFQMSDYAVSIRKPGGVSKEEKGWRGRKLAVEDPFSHKRNLVRSVHSTSTLDYISDSFKIAFRYFGAVQTIRGPVIHKIVVPGAASPKRKRSPTIGDHNSENSSSNKSGLEKESENVRELFEKFGMSGGAEDSGFPPLDNANATASSTSSGDPGKILRSAITLESLEKSLKDEIDESSESTEDSSDDDDEEEEEDIFQPRAKLNETWISYIEKHGQDFSPKQAKRLVAMVPKASIFFTFDRLKLTEGHVLVSSCTVCNKEGHLQTACPDEILPKVRPAARLPAAAMQLLDAHCRYVQHTLSPSPHEIKMREQFVEDLERFVKRFHKNSKLNVMGSSCNGLGFSGCDLDVSMTFEDKETDEGLDAIGIIEDLGAKLKNMSGIRNVQPITAAKVPIVKFSHMPSKIEGDISLYNVLGQENTKMLRFYTSIDDRVRLLGYMAKNFAKTCQIGDASRGSLSSYAYILMLVHYLQKGTEPPVLPVLQELYPEGTKQPVKMVDGWNAWFFDDHSQLDRMWPHVGRNRESPYQLWLGFLLYYAERFEDKDLCVCIRRSEPLTKFEKMWNSPCLTIEDPFDLNHNLGAGLSRRMNIFIKTAFIKAYEHFGNPVALQSIAMRISPDFLQSELYVYFWDNRRLTSGELPTDRGCRMCGKIGHIVRDCPKKTESKDYKKDFNKQRRGDRGNNNNGRRERNTNRNDRDSLGESSGVIVGSPMMNKTFPHVGGGGGQRPQPPPNMGLPPPHSTPIKQDPLNFFGEPHLNNLHRQHSNDLTNSRGLLQRQHSNDLNNSRGLLHRQQSDGQIPNSHHQSMPPPSFPGLPNPIPSRPNPGNNEIGPPLGLPLRGAMTVEELERMITGGDTNQDQQQQRPLIRTDSGPQPPQRMMNNGFDHHPQQQHQLSRSDSSGVNGSPSNNPLPSLDELRKMGLLPSSDHPQQPQQNPGMPPPGIFPPGFIQQQQQRHPMMMPRPQMNPQAAMLAQLMGGGGAGALGPNLRTPPPFDSPAFNFGGLPGFGGVGGGGPPMLPGLNAGGLGGVGQTLNQLGDAPGILASSSLSGLSRNMETDLLKGFGSRPSNNTPPEQTHPQNSRND